MIHQHAAEGRAGARFAFGDNWLRFLSVLDEERICEAEESLQRVLKLDSLEGRSFLDVGSGSGLFSLAARRLGATVRSIDYEPQSVACTEELRRRYFRDDARWAVEQASALDPDYLGKIGQFDIVYLWGVLHHTGQMWRALLLIGIHASYLFGARWAVRALKVRAPERGMSLWYDMIDWLGGVSIRSRQPRGDLPALSGCRICSRATYNMWWTTGLQRVRFPPTPVTTASALIACISVESPAEADERVCAA